MIQIIGWLGCVYLFIRSLSMITSNDFKNPDGGTRAAAAYLAVFGVIASIGFAIWLGDQGLALQSNTALSGVELEAAARENCLEFSQNPADCEL